MTSPSVSDLLSLVISPEGRGGGGIVGKGGGGGRAVGDDACDAGRAIGIGGTVPPLT